MNELTPRRDVEAARRRAERIRIKARTISEQYEGLLALIDEAERCEDHLALGYASWTAYIADLFSDEPLRLPRDERIPMSRMLTEQGMSTRAVGTVLGVDHKTVVNDLAGEYSPPAERIDPHTGEVVPGPTFKPTDVTDWPQEDVDLMDQLDQESVDAWEDSTVPAPKPVTGLDGKTYTRKPSATPPRQALTATFFNAAYDVNRRIESLHRLVSDDRFPQNAQKIAQKHLSDLLASRDLLQQVIDQLS